jgi:hypothetical protein
MAHQNPQQTQRGWEDWLGIIMGIAIVFAPWIVDETSNHRAVLNATCAGAAILMLCELDLVQMRRWPEVGLVALGAWVAISPFVFGYSANGSLRLWHVIAGIAVALLAANELRQKLDTSH